MLAGEFAISRGPASTRLTGKSLAVAVAAQISRAPRFLEPPPTITTEAGPRRG